MSSLSAREETVQRAEEDIRRLLQEDRPVNFNTVAQVAGGSPAWLYQHPERRQRIEHLRAQQSTQMRQPSKTKTSDAPKDAMVAALRLRVKQVEAKNRELRRQLEVVYGQLSHHHS